MTGEKMNTLENLRNKIEEVRKELNEKVVSEEYESYYAKSVELDQLSAEYVDLEEQIPA